MCAINIIFTHCSALIAIADLKLKMSRSYCSYNEEWQRRKSVLIRSLFHDIPILSPVEEESDTSYHNIPRQEVFASPPRTYSPLPPLIIERIPVTNKHDEPEEYYVKLHKKIKRIYQKLFVEKRNLSSIDYDLNSIDTSVRDDEVTDSDGSSENLDFSFLERSPLNDGHFDSIIEDREARESSASTKSNGYEADLESKDTAIIDVVNYTTSNEDPITISEEEESDSENFDGGAIRNKDSRSSENTEISRERKDDEEEELSGSRTDDQDLTESEESSESEIERAHEKKGSDDYEIVEVTGQTAESDGVGMDDPEFSEGEESHHSTIDDNVMTEIEELKETENAGQSTKSRPFSCEKEVKSNESEGEKELKASNFEPMEESVESSEGPGYKRITTAAIVHFDGSQDAEERESQVYEDSIKSDILPTRNRRVILTALEDNEDPETDPTIDENETTEEDFEEVTSPQAYDGHEEETELMRTPRTDLSRGTIPITNRSRSESTTEHTALSQEPTGLTSSSQNGVDNNISEIQTSNEINEILTSIFNESRNKDEAPISGRKRKLVDKSIQTVSTSRVTWDDIRTNFFIGTPKIFRLCACSDHVCN